MNTNRRRFLSLTAPALIVPLTAGCTSDEEPTSSSNGENSEENETPTPTPTPTEGTTLTDILEITNHEWRGASILEVTVENQTEDTLDLVQVEANLYVENERIGHAFTNISSLAGGTSTTSQIRFIEGYDQAPCNATRYDLFPNFRYDGTRYEKRFEYEFNPVFCE